MKYSMNKILARSMSMLIVLLLLFACSSPGSRVNLTLVNNSIQTGDVVTVQVELKEVTDLTAVELHLSFDPAMLEVVELKPGSLLSPDFVVQNTFDNAAGTIDYAAAQIDRAPASGSGTLLEIILQAKGSGTSSIALRSTDAVPAGILLSDSKGAAVPVATAKELNVSIR